MEGKNKIEFWLHKFSIQSKICDAAPRLSKRYELHVEVILDVATVRFGTLVTTAIGVQVYIAIH